MLGISLESASDLIRRKSILQDTVKCTLEQVWLHLNDVNQTYKFVY
jgi:hypothetical protein